MRFVFDKGVSTFDVHIEDVAELPKELFQVCASRGPLDSIYVHLGIIYVLIVYLLLR